MSTKFTGNTKDLDLPTASEVLRFFGRKKIYLRSVTTAKEAPVCVF
jgi:hypothetical protein